MKNRLIALALAATTLGAGGCAENLMTLEAYGVCAMPETCSFSGECSMYQLGAIGYLSAIPAVTGGTEYAWLQLGIELRNQLENNADPQTGRVNSNDAHVTGLRLEIEGPASGDIEQDVGHQTVPADGSAVVWTYVLPPNYVVPLPSGTYNVGVVFIGYFDNGREFETPPFPVAVELSNDPAADPFGCLPGDVVVCGSEQQSVRACGTI